MNQFTINPTFKEKKLGITSKQLTSILPQNLTFNAHHLLFGEIELLPIEHNDKEKELLTLPDATSKYSLDKTSQWIINKIKNHILDCWNKEKLHIVYYRSNVESKILSVILRQLYNENKDLGNILFIKIPPESGSYQELMEHTGWYNEYSYILSDTIIHKAFMSFDKAHWLNFPSSLGDNLNSLISAILADRDIKDYQLIDSVGWLDKANHKAGNKLNSVVHDYVLDIYPDDAILPFISYPVLEAGIKSRHRGMLPFALLEYLDKDLIKFENGYDNARPIHKFIQNYLMSAYEQSWYYKMFGLRLIIPDRVNLFGDWSERLLQAMLTETLIKKGYKIEAF